MNIWIGMIFAAFLVSAEDTSSAAPREESAQALMAKVQAFYDRTASMTAEFEQEAVRARTGRTNRRSGRVRVLRPDRIRWDYRIPEPVHYVTDGTILWVYQPQDALVYRMGLEQGGLDQAVRFLAGGIRILEKFNGRLRSAPERLERDDLLFLELTPKDEMGSLGTLILGVQAESGAVLFSSLVDPEGNEVRTTYRDLKETPLAASVFVFEPPAGVRVEDLSGKGAGPSRSKAGGAPTPEQVPE